jgi:hypothetical protein
LLHSKWFSLWCKGCVTEKTIYIAFGYIQNASPYGVRTMLMKNQYNAFGYIQSGSPYGVRTALAKKQ